MAYVRQSRGVSEDGELYAIENPPYAVARGSKCVPKGVVQSAKFEAREIAIVYTAGLGILLAKFLTVRIVKSG